MEVLFLAFFFFELCLLNFMPTASGIFTSGKKTGVGTTAVQLTTNNVYCVFGVLVQADQDNTGDIYVYAQDDADGIRLQPGDGYFVEIDNANKVYVKASVADQVVRWSAT